MSTPAVLPSSRRLWWQFLVACTGSALRGRWSMPGGHRPPRGGAVIQPQFFGVGVATHADPAVDVWIIEALRAAGISHVRLDFTECDPGGAAERFLESLLDAGFSVLLHVFQTPAEARLMPEAQAEARWEALLEHLLTQHGERVWGIEVGSTLNRERWAGYTLRGFLSMWEAAWQAAHEHGVCLAGPSVTDFEPPWNVGLLNLLARRGRLPQVHTDNLFSERCTEPERFDHKILGHRLTGLHRFNLVKKARLLQRIGADAGVPRLLSPAAFWTLPRIARTLPDSEQKQADYLTRYLVLCAASGALEGAWWGPLVCHREGLVDDGVTPYPSLERITHYASVGGDLTRYRYRPAFDALRTISGELTGMAYAGRLNCEPGLEIHAFRQGESCLHVAWTINGRSAALGRLYAQESLACVTLRTRDGEPLFEPQHQLLSETPIFLRWSGGNVPVPAARLSLLHGVALHRHRPDGGDWFFEEADWQGVVRAASLSEAKILWQNLLPALQSGPSAAGLMRKARNAIWTLPENAICSQGEGGWVVKKPVKMHLHKRFLDRFKPSKAVRSWSGSCELLRRGIAAAPPVAYIERRVDPGLLENYYVCSRVAADFSIRDVFSALAQGESAYAGIAADTIYAWVADYLLRLHARGIHFRDLSGGNLLVEVAEGQPWRFTLIDTGRLRAYNQALPLRLRLDDLVRVCNKLHWAGREALLGRYYSAMGRPFGRWQRLPFYLYDWKVELKRRYGRKALKRLLRA